MMSVAVLEKGVAAGSVSEHSSGTRRIVELLEEHAARLLADRNLPSGEHVGPS